MKVFLTGATGHIGSAVTERLRAAGHEVSALARSDTSAGKLAATGIRAVRGDFSDPRSITAAAREADGVISLATTYDPSIDGPAIDTILDALSGSNKPFIYTSGIWSHGDTGGKVVDETAPPKPAQIVSWRQAVEDRVLQGSGRGIRSGDPSRHCVWPGWRHSGRVRRVRAEGRCRAVRRYRRESLAFRPRGRSR